MFPGDQAIEIAERDRLRRTRRAKPAHILWNGWKICATGFQPPSKEIRGRGLMLGVELHDVSDSSSNAIRMLCQQNTWVIWRRPNLLNVHCIRIARL